MATASRLYKFKPCRFVTILILLWFRLNKMKNSPKFWIKKT